VVFEEFVDAPLPNVVGKRGRSHHWPDKVHADKLRSIQHLAVVSRMNGSLEAGMRSLWAGRF